MFPRLIDYFFSYLLLCNNYTKTYQLKTTFIITVSVSQECRCGLAGYLWLKVTHEVTGKLWTRAAVTLSLDEAYLSSPMWLLAGLRWASRLTHVGLSTELPYSMAADFPLGQERADRASKTEGALFYNLILDVLSLLLYSVG